MYTNGKIIIERKNLRIEITTERSFIVYFFRTQEEAHCNFVTLIMANEKFHE